ncbi:DNA polymerase III delta prime subunit [Litorimonas taeanensis]|uniref:DNA polymerase III delta prime subunit n=1 Tax=Litorimonas taeanensis TaxID=568099 RepID=A0A420WK21_9PROT|nr:DNA polymerase III subunit delta' [Litorimonas taeanensis]RKQ71373.1 DNA polymerase III delta prime subunit [Litorimonas taeanensis]
MAKGFDTEPLPESDRAPACLHPRETYDLLGHSEAERRFIQAQQSGRLHHAWLLTGPPGIGKATLAYRMSRALLGGQSLMPESLNIPKSDPISQRIESRGHGNLFVVNRPWDSKTKKFKQDIPVDLIRSVGEFLQGTAAEDKESRVVIIDSADDLNRNAENALLKMLEEPPSKTVMILLSSSPGRLLPTIRSRCMAVPLKAVPKADIVDWLSRQGQGSKDMVEACANLSRGGPGKAMALAQNASEVLMPLKRFMESLDTGRVSIDIGIAKSLATQNAAVARALFWDVLEDSIQACAVYSQTDLWEGAFAPPNNKRNPEKWLKAWSLIREQKAIEAAINTDKTATLLNTLSAVRAA